MHRVRYVVLGALGLFLGACGANPGNPINLNVRNNTSEAVVLRACDGNGPSCDSVAYTATVSPGTSTSTAQFPDRTVRPMMVTTRSGRTLGCLPIQLSKVPPTAATVQVSQMIPCGRSLGAKATGGGDWPFSQY